MTKYDDADHHEDSAIDAAGPRENAEDEPRVQAPSSQETTDGSDWAQADRATKQQLVEQMQKIARAMGVELPPDFIKLTEAPTETEKPG